MKKEGEVLYPSQRAQKSAVDQTQGWGPLCWNLEATCVVVQKCGMKTRGRGSLIDKNIDISVFSKRLSAFLEKWVPGFFYLKIHACNTSS